MQTSDGILALVYIQKDTVQAAKESQYLSKLTGLFGHFWSSFHHFLFLLTMQTQIQLCFTEQKLKIQSKARFANGTCKLKSFIVIIIVSSKFHNVLQGNLYGKRTDRDL